MGWLFSLVLIIIYAFTKESYVLVASSLFAIAGAIESKR